MYLKDDGASALLFWLLVARLSPRACGHETPSQESQRTPANLSTPSAFLNNSYLAFNLYKQMVAKHPDQNFMFSPLSLSIPLTLLAFQAPPEIRTEVLEGLGWGAAQVPEDRVHEHYSELLLSWLPPPGQCHLDTGSMLFLDKNIHLIRKFANIAQSLYHTKASLIPFNNYKAAQEMMDSFIRKKTQGNIEKLAQTTGPNVVLILANYMLITVEWKYRFNPKFTKMEAFHLKENFLIPVFMMQRLGWFQVHRLNHLHSDLLRLPFSCNITAVFILPDLGLLKQVEEALMKEDLNTWTQPIPPSRRRLFMPKFSLSWRMQLDQLLPELGIWKIFRHFYSLSGVAAQTMPMRVSKAVQVAMLTVDEKGAEEEDITDFQFLPKAFLPHLRMDKPFLFLIFEENSRSLLLMGKVINPSINLEPVD
ncbi:PREDICTED: alpha-1-antitrypsin-like [Condylura cristata]|uniref:alpha-1-antitrypsin-like n=1 Tax=Condylura cristata TaxID=143302 RepID=UPI00033468D8|nr:PREDICTED: alpha-1-antitrypsin-like [Condylura cristata]